MTIADAIATQENTPASWNNPGALTAAPSSFCQNGTVPGSAHIVQFCTPQDGWAELDFGLGTGFSWQPHIGLHPKRIGMDWIVAGYELVKFRFRFVIRFDR
jgi:hypothetical protein